MQAGNIEQKSSDIESCMHIATPAKSVLTINFDAHTRFIAASELPRSEDLWAPTNTIGIGVSSTINERAAEATERLSVPMPIIMPSTPFFASFSISFAIKEKCLNLRSSDHILLINLELKLAIFFSSGTWLNISSGVNEEKTAPVL